MRTLLELRGVDVRASVARDPSGAWPDERGFALFAVTAEFAQVLARTFDQFAFYDVREGAVLVRGSANGEAVT